MTNQHEITKRMPLLNREGNLTEPGWARGLLWDYHRPDIRASGMRIKEWDYYFVSNGHIGLALTIADNGYMGLDSVSYLDFDEKWEITKSPMRLLPMGTTALPETSTAGSSEIARGGYALAFYHDDDGTRKLTFHMDKFRGKDAIEGMISLSDEPAESMVIATPFEKSGHFYYNQKINCMRASGWIELGQVRFEIPMQDGEENYLAPWRFSSDDGRFEMAFAPILNRAAYTSVGVIKSDQNQVFGRFTGTAALDDGTVLQVNDFFGFAEKVENKW